MAVLLFLDVILLTVWTVLDPLKREVRLFAKITLPDEDVEILPMLEHCKSKHHNFWLGEDKACS